MVDNLKYDRPLTSNIRRRNYKVIGKESLSSINKFRYKSMNHTANCKSKQIRHL